MNFFPDTGFAYLSNEELMKLSYLNKDFNQRAIRALFSRSSAEALAYQAQLIAKIIRHGTPKKLTKPPLINRQWINNPQLHLADRINGIYFLAAQNTISLERNETDFQKLYGKHIKTAVAGLTQSTIESLQEQMLSRNDNYLTVYADALAINLSKLNDAQKSILSERLKDAIKTLFHRKRNSSKKLYEVLIRLKLPKEILQSICDNYVEKIDDKSYAGCFYILKPFLPYITLAQAKKILKKVDDNILPALSQYLTSLDRLADYSQFMAKIYDICQVDFSKFVVEFFEKNKTHVDDKPTDLNYFELVKLILWLGNFNTRIDIDIGYILDKFSKTEETFSRSLYCIGCFLPKLSAQEISIAYNKILFYLKINSEFISKPDFLYALKNFIPYFKPVQLRCLFEKHLQHCVIDALNYRNLTNILCLLAPNLRLLDLEKVFQMVLSALTLVDYRTYRTYLKVLNTLAPYLTQSHVDQLINKKLVENFNDSLVTGGRGYNDSHYNSAMNLISLLIVLKKYDITEAKLSPELLKQYPIKILKELNEWVKKIDEAVRQTPHLTSTTGPKL